MGSVASDLKSERQRRNISLAQIAADTKISLHYLESLEEGRYGDLPGGMYNRAFLRAYCERLNLNQQEMLSRYEAEISPPLDKVLKSKMHLYQKSATLKPSPVIIWSLMLLISAAGLFFSRKWIAGVFSPYFSRKPAVIMSQEIAKPAPPAAATKPGAQALVQATVSQVSPESGTSESAVVQPANSSGSAPLAASVPVPKTQNANEPDLAIPSSPSLLRLEIGISEKCWISVDRDGSPAFRKLMDPGEIHSFNANEQFLLIVGNAGGAHLKINGKSTKPLGKSGEVVKILINEKNLQALLDQTAG
jgi:cytoskeletal protein RodZ